MAGDNSGQKTLKWVSLATLTFQNAILGLSIRYARIQPGDLFLSSTAVVMSEVVKLIACLLIVFIQEKSIARGCYMVYAQVIKQPVDTLKVCVPSLIYTLQNNLIFIAASNLDAATYQVTYQLKILTTALLSVLMLKKVLGLFHWVALVILLVGVSLVQLTDTGSSAASTGGHEQNRLLGLVAVIISCCMSGFAGVYFEKILKGSDVSVWMRNVQLSVLGIPFALCTTFISDWSKVHERGFFFGYNEVVWFVVLMYALGGLLVAVVVKYADNILKGFATSLAIIVACVASIYMFDFHVTYQFSCGTALVIFSVLLYGQQEAATAHLSKSSQLSSSKNGLSKV